MPFDTLWQEVKDLEVKIANLDAAIEEIVSDHVNQGVETRGL